MIEAKEQRLVDAEKVCELRERVEIQMKDPECYESACMIKWTLEELGLWDGQAMTEEGNKKMKKELKTDADTAIHIRNTALELAQIAKENNIRINIWADQEGYADAMFGKYSYHNYTSGDEKFRNDDVESADYYKEVTLEEIHLTAERRDTDVNAGAD